MCICIFFAFACVMQKLLCSTKTSTASTVVLKRDSCSSSISMTSANVASLIMPWHQHNKEKEGNKVVQECVTVCCILTIKNNTPQQDFQWETGYQGNWEIVPSRCNPDTFGIGSHKLWSKKIGNNVPERRGFKKKNNNSITKKEMILVEISVLFHDLLWNWKRHNSYRSIDLGWLGHETETLIFSLPRNVWSITNARCA